MPDPLALYTAKRDFERTSEPQGDAAPAVGAGLTFCVQKHDASTLHYDLRLEWDGVLWSWAVTKGPSADPSDKRLAVRTEDHPLDYATFEGTIPKKEYGGGTVMLWDFGTWEPLHDPAEGIASGKLHLRLHGGKMTGGWALVRMREQEKNWLLIKEKDAAAGAADSLTKGTARSVKTGRTMKAIAAGETAEDVLERPAKAGQSGARPAFRDAQLATLVNAAPEGDGWWHETKLDGYRCLVALGRGGPAFYTRNGKDWSDRFADLAPAMGALSCADALIDGEVMAAGAGRSAFSALQRALSEGGALEFFAFDLLALDGVDLTGEPLVARRAQLEKLFAGAPEALRLTDYVRGQGAEVHDAACRAGAEGIVSKKVDAPYRGGRGRTWRKVKCTRRQEFVVGGYTPSDKAGRPFASLLMGAWEGDDLAYRGRVGTGFGMRDFEELPDRWSERKTPPFADVPGEIARDAVWLTPALVAEVEFTELTADGHIRHGSFQGVRSDKAAEEVRMETPESATVEVAGVEITHPDRVIYPDAGVTKADLARYVASAGPRMIEIVGHRPLALLRHPQGIGEDGFFQKHPGRGWPDAMQRIEIEESDGGTGTYLYATRTEALVEAVQMGTVEVHMWGARTDRLERPDRLVFDLDPDEGLGWADVRATATDVRDRLDRLGLTSGALVTGGKGVHVWVPLRRDNGWETVKLFAKTLAHVMAEAAPDRYTATMSKAKRKGRVFIDWLRNERGATAICPYSPRAREGAPVAVPVTWDQLEKLDAPGGFTLSDASDWWPERCPYLDLLDSKQAITDATVEKLEKMR